MNMLQNFDWNAFFQQFLYDSKNPLLFNNGFFVPQINQPYRITEMPIGRMRFRGLNSV